MRTRTSRRPLAWSLLLVLGLLAAACGGGGDDAGGGGGGGGGTEQTGDTTATTQPAPSECPVEALDQATGPVEITYWHAMNAELETALKTLTDRYNASQDKVKVTLVNQGGYRENFDKYRATSAADRPDLAQFSEVYLQIMIDSKTAVPAQACIDASGYDTTGLLPQVQSFFTVDQVLWPMPFNISNPVLYYNKEIFRKAGLDPEKPPLTLDELRQYSQQIVDSGAAAFGLAVDTGFDSGGGWFIEQWFAKAGELFLDNDNGRSGRATEVLFNNEKGVEYLTWLQEMEADGLAVNVGRNESARDVLLKLADPTERAAMGINTSAALSSALAVLASGTIEGVELGLGPMPGPEGEGSVLVGGAANWIVKGEDPARIAAAWDFAGWLAEPEQQAEWSVSTGYVPLREQSVDLPVITEAWTEQPEYRVAYDQLLGGVQTPATAGSVTGAQQQIREFMGKGLEEIFGGADVKTTLDKVAGQSNAAIADYAKRTGTG